MTRSCRRLPTPTPTTASSASRSSNPCTPRPSLQAILPPALAEHFDWTSSELRPGSFVDTHLTQRHIDVLYRVKVGQSDALIHVLLEHQREVEPLMAYRLLRYCVRIWEDWLRTAPWIWITSGTMLIKPPASRIRRP